MNAIHYHNCDEIVIFPQNTGYINWNYMKIMENSKI